MAYNAENLDDEEAQRQRQQAANAAFRQSISTPEGMQAYNNQIASNWQDIQNHTGAYQDFGGGGFFDTLGHIMEPIMNTVIKYGPAVYGAAVGASALGAMGAGAGAAAEGAGAAGAADAGVGLGAGIGTGAGTEAAAGAGGLGGLFGGTEAAGAGAGALAGGITDAGTVVIPGVAGSAGGGLGAGSVLGGMAGTGVGLGVLGDGGTIPNDGSLSNVYNVQGQEPVGVQGGDMPVVTVPPPVVGTGGLGNGGTWVDNFKPPFVPIPTGGGLTDIPKINGSGGDGTGSGGIPGGSGIPGIGDVLGGLGGILGAGAGYQMNQADKDYWQNLMNKAMGMYMPGTPEADMLEHKMEAQDAAAGRNSQYGVREQNLAALLSQQRANIMMSPQFYKMGEAARGHYDAGLNNIFGGLGTLTSGSGLNTLNNLFGVGSSMWNGLSGMFGGGSNSSGAVDNTLF